MASPASVRLAGAAADTAGTYASLVLLDQDPVSDSDFQSTGMELENGVNTTETSAGKQLVSSEEGEIQMPCVGMEFDSEEDAKKFYDEYARRTGFVIRLDHCRRSEVDKSVISRVFSCNKQGYHVKKGHFGPVRKQRSSIREGCMAMMLVKVNKSGKWTIMKFEKEHTHPLVTSGCASSNATDAKDRKIQQLTTELQRQDMLCNLYKEQILLFLKSVEEQTDRLSTRIQDVVSSVRDVETQVENTLQQHSQH